MAAFVARHRWTIAAALLLALVYGISLSILPKHVFWMPDEGAKLFQLQACGLSWKEGVTYRIPFAGQRLLPGNEFLPGFDVFPEPRTAADGSLYLEFDTPVVFPLLSAPFYHAFGAVGLYIVPLACGWLSAVLSGVIASWFVPPPAPRRPLLVAPAAVLLVGLGTPVWFYSVVFWEHTLATLLGLIAVALLVRAPRRVETVAAIVPVILLASMLRTEMAAFGAALFVAWVVVALNARRQPAPAHGVASVPRPRANPWRVVAFSLAATIALVAVLNTSLTARHRALIGVLPERINHAFSGIANVPQGMFEVFINSQNLGPRVGLAWRAAAILAVLLGLAAPLVRSPRVQAMMIVAASSMMLTCSAALIFTGEPYRGLHGLFPVAPYAILWPLALRHAWRRRDAPLLALGTATWVFLLFAFAALALTYIHQGLLDVGMQWGQRYLLTAYPMLAILALLALRRLRVALRPGLLRSAALTLVALLVASAVSLEIRGLRMLYGTRGIMAEWDQAMRSEDGPVVTTVWWIVPAVADLFLTHEMFFTWRPGVARWVEAARQRGVTSFTLAHTEPLTEEELGWPDIRRASDTRMFTGGLLLTRFQINPVAAQ